MPALHRLQWIDAQIRAGSYPNTRALAEHFEISRCQAQRDFDYLRDSLGAPLAYDAKRRGFCYTADAYVLPGPYVTPTQKSVLNRMAVYYDQVSAGESGGSPFFQEMAALFARLGGGEPHPPVPETFTETSAPYRAIVSFPWERLSPRLSPLAPFDRGQDAQGRLICEFIDPQQFLGALLATGQSCRIEWPGWLRRSFEAHLRQLLQANTDQDR